MKIYKQELLELYKGSKLHWDGTAQHAPQHKAAYETTYVTYDNENVYCFVKYEDLDITKLIKNYKKSAFPARSTDFEILTPTGVQLLHEQILKIYDEKTTRILFNLILDIRNKFNQYHFLNDRSGILYCSIYCDKKYEQDVDEGLKILSEVWGDFLKSRGGTIHKKSEDILFKATNKHGINFSITRQKTEHYAVFSIDIVLFYEIAGHDKFAWRLKLSDEHGKVKR